MGPGIFTFSELVSILFRNISKQLKHLDLVNFCFSPFQFFLYNPLFQFFPYIIHCFSVSSVSTPEMGPGIFTFSELVSILFRNVSKQLKHLDLVNFLPVSVRFSFFPI